eukprot:14683593-Alexandrium_andersonii.AAC.1
MQVFPEGCHHGSPEVTRASSKAGAMATTTKRPPPPRSDGRRWREVWKQTNTTGALFCSP